MNDKQRGFCSKAQQEIGELIELLDANYYHLETFLLEVEKLEKNNSQLEGIKLKSTPNNDDDSNLFYNLSRASKGESRETSLSDAGYRE